MNVDIGITAIDIDIDGVQITVDVEIVNFDAVQSAPNVTLAFRSPPQLDFLAANPSDAQGRCTVTTDVRCSYPELPADQSRTISFLFTRSMQGTVSESVSLTSDLPDVDPRDNEATLHIPDARVPGDTPALTPDPPSGGTDGGDDGGVTGGGTGGVTAGTGTDGGTGGNTAGTSTGGDTAGGTTSGGTDGTADGGGGETGSLEPDPDPPPPPHEVVSGGAFDAWLFCLLAASLLVTRGRRGGQDGGATSKRVR